MSSLATTRFDSTSKIHYLGMDLSAVYDYFTLELVLVILPVLDLSVLLCILRGVVFVILQKKQP